MPTLLKDLVIREVSSVDRGAGEGVKVVLMKRDDDAVESYLKRNLFEEAEARAKVEKREFSGKERDKLAETGAALPDGSFPIENKSDLENAIHAYGRARDKEKAKAHIIARAKDLGAADMIPADWTKRADLILEAVKKFGFPGQVDPDNDAKTWADALQENAFWDLYWKATGALQTSICSILNDEDATDKAGMVEQTLAQFSAFMTQIIPDQVGKSLAALAKTAGVAGITKGDVMSDEVKKALGLLPTATDAQVAAAFAKRDQEQAAAVAKLQNELAILKMSDKHKQYAIDTGMSDDAKAKFAAKSADERDKQMADNPVEKNLPESVVKALKESEDLKKRLADLEAKDKAASFAKRAEEIGLTGQGEMLQKAHAGDPEAIKKMEEIIKAASAQEKTATIFKEFGSANANPSGASASDQLTAKAAELRKADPKLTQAQAFAKAYKDPANKDLVALAKREEQSGRAA